ncbi:MAG: polyprenyl synthetase family protein [Cellvibrionales bacterium]|nr:polyprenyl synthetase family protein [Cellvibrionales bacterium]
MQAARELIQDQLEAVNNRIIEKLQSRVKLVENIGEYLVSAGGKRLRPVLALLAGKITGFAPQHIDFATVIEFIHSATLLHDDVVDLSELRRGRPTANANFGNASSVLVGDFIYSRAFQILVELGSMPVMKLLSDTTNQIAEGEVLQLAKAGDPECSIEDYLQVITDKTGILFAAAMKGSAILSDASEEIQQALYDFGMNLGIAFQLADDALDYQGDANLIGKNVGDDLAEGKPTLPLIKAMELGTPDEKAVVYDAIQNKTKENLNHIINITQKTGAIEITYQLALDYIKQAKTALSIIEPSAYTQALAELADFAAGRQS